MIEENALNIYTDGSSYSKPRRGGYGIRIIYVDDQGKERIQDIPIFKSFAGATNNQMELLACVTAIEESKKSKYYSKVRKINIFIDSMYVSQNYNTAIFHWSVNKWMTRVAGRKDCGDCGTFLDILTSRIIFVSVEGL